MATNRRTLKLPSGREVTIKPVGIAEFYRIQGVLPDLGAEMDEGAITSRQGSAAGIRMIVECVVEPKFYFDTRTEDQRVLEPRPMPDGMTELDLSIGDFAMIVEELSKEIESIKDTLNPLPATATP